jgi:RNA polymerase sigma factor for flagellar operon FliA
MSYDKHSLILSHIELAETIANREWRTATHALEKSEMISLAYLGLVDAAERWEPYCEKNEYDPSAVQFFKVFASFRIRGSIRDHLRKEDWATRTLRSKAKKLKEAGQDEGLSVVELAEKTDMTVAEINKVVARLASRPVSLDAKRNTPDYNAGSPQEEYQIKEDVDTEGIAFANDMNAVFVKRLRQLPFEAQVIIVLHYYNKMDLRSIAEKLSLSESKVSQIHATGVLSIREAMTQAATELV